MLFSIISICDTKVGYFERPVCLQNRVAAIRACVDLVNDPSTQYSKHAADFALFELGTFDDATGIITAHPAPVNVTSFHEIKATSH